MSARTCKEKTDQFKEKAFPFLTVCRCFEDCALSSFHAVPSHQTQVRTAESGVEQHQAYQDAVQACRDWMSAARDRLAVCGEAGGDRQSLQNRLDRLQVITGQTEGYHKTGCMQFTEQTGQTAGDVRLNRLQVVSEQTRQTAG